MNQQLMTVRPAIGALAAALLSIAAPAFAHEQAYNAALDGPQAGTASTATGSLHMEANEHVLVFDVLQFSVDGIHVEDLDQSHGPNQTAIHIHWNAPHPLGTGHGPILIDLGWYVREGFGTITPTANGFDITVSGVVLDVQGLYDMTGTTGLAPADVLHEMEMGETSIRIHTVEFPEGEIAGVIIPEQTVQVQETAWSDVKNRFRVRF